MTEQSDDGPCGSLGDAMRFVSAVQDWATRTFPAPADGHAGSDCQWCPVCQFVSVLRGERPDVSERVAEAGVALASAFRAFVNAATPKAEDSTGQPDRDDSRQRHRDDAGQPRVQRIDLDADHLDAVAFGPPPTGSE